MCIQYIYINESIRYLSDNIRQIQAALTDSGTGTSSCVPEGALIARRVSPSGRQTYKELTLIREDIYSFMTGNICFCSDTAALLGV